MQRRLILTGPADRPIFNILYTGFLSGGTPPAGAPAPRTEGKEHIYQLARIKRALVQLSEAMPKDEEQPSGAPIRLKDGRHELRLEQRDCTLLEQHICRTQWLVIVTDVVADTLDRLSAAEEVTDDPPTPPPAKG